MRVSRARSSLIVIWPTIEIWAPVAQSGEFLVMVDSLSPSQARRMCDDNVLPARSITASALANSASTIINRLLAMPGSMISSRPSFLFHSRRSSRTALMSPSPEESPPFSLSSLHPWSATFMIALTRPKDVPLRAFELSPTSTANRFVWCRSSSTR